MPLFDYRCVTCGHEFEKLIRRMVSRAMPRIICPKCGALAAKMLPMRLAAHCFGVGIYKPSKKD